MWEELVEKIEGECERLGPCTLLARKRQTPHACTSLPAPPLTALRAAALHPPPLSGAGFNGLNRDSLNLFANLCGIPHAGNGQCRRMARAKARSGGRTSIRSTVRRTSGSTHN